ncbi:MAG: hypothetical protein WKG01_01320 [Kofleriaceae bacterium]
MNKNGSGTDTMTDNIKDKVSNLVDQGQEKASAIKDRVLEVKDQAVTRGEDVLDRAVELIKANPIKAVGLAFGVGYIGMRLFRR